MKVLFSFSRFLLTSALLAVCGSLLLISSLALYFGPRLPQINSVLDLKLQSPLRVYSQDGKLIGEFGETRRQPLPYHALPPLFVKAVLAAEDDRFFQHPGVDATGLLRAASELIKSGRIQSGGSTITMQLARNFFLSSEKSFVRKFNEILLSIMLERSLSKEQIFELYANKIFLGNRAYGAQAAAYVYYGMHLNDLSLAQWAMLAGLPKAPSKYNPLVNPARALTRRNWILGRMLQLEYIDQLAYDKAIAEVETARFHGLQTDVDAPYIAEMARQFALEKLGESAYTEGYSVYTTIDSHLQTVAQQAVWDGVIEYDKRHGYRGAEKRVDVPQSEDNSLWASLLKNEQRIVDLEPAVVKHRQRDTLTCVLRNGTAVEITWSQDLAKSLRPYKSENHVGPQPSRFDEIFSPGDVIRLKPIEDNQWQIGQLPRAQAALVSIDSHDGSIRALAGGSSFYQSKFNRVTQALRQPGSSFKPFFYLRALEQGYTPASLINDAPIVFQEAGMEKAWRPENAGDDYLGPIRLRQALYQSRNMVSIRLLQSLGVQDTISTFNRFGFDTSNMQPNLSIALGSHAMTPLALAGGYAILSNGGFQVTPYLVDKIESSDGTLAYQSNPATVTACHACDTDGSSFPTQNPAERVVDEQSLYIIDDMLKDVIQKGTGRPAMVLNRTDIAGKTGTTNGPTDAWFAGYTPAIATVTWLGFDDNSYLGKKEYGGTAALPIWINYMREALQQFPVQERAMPAGLSLVKIDPETGAIADSERNDAMFEIFRTESLPASSTSPTTEPAPSHQTPSTAVPADLSEDIF